MSIAAGVLWFMSALIGVHCLDIVATQERKQFRDTWIQWHLAAALVMSLTARVILHFTRPQS